MCFHRGFIESYGMQQILRRDKLFQKRHYNIKPFKYLLLKIQQRQLRISNKKRLRTSWRLQRRLGDRPCKSKKEKVKNLPVCCFTAVFGTNTSAQDLESMAYIMMLILFPYLIIILTTRTGTAKKMYFDLSNTTFC